jgi:hypothetical protein
MQELFPLAGGAIVGGLVLLISSLRWRVGAFILGCLVIGVAASWLSGELEESFAFISIDMLLVWIGGLVAVLAITGLRRTTFGRRLFRS